jgi:hypothetical protein
MKHELTVIPTVGEYTRIDEIINHSLGGIRTGLIFKSDAPIDVHDGYHSMQDLYRHRHALFCALLKVLDSYVTPMSVPYARCWKSKLHDDGSMYEGWFIAEITLNTVPWTGPIETQTIAYHMPMEFWDNIQVVELEKAPPYDNYTPDDVIRRLLAI